jgi:hypothetical protein
MAPWLAWLGCLLLSGSSAYWVVGWRREALLLAIFTWVGFGVAFLMPMYRPWAFIVYTGFVLGGTLLNRDTRYL